MDRVFGSARKFNAVAITVGVTLLLLIGGGIFLRLFEPPVNGNEGVRVEAKSDLPFDIAAVSDKNAMTTGPLTHISGTHFFSAEISDRASEEAKSEFGGRSRRALDNARNILVYDGTKRETWRLFSDSFPLILKSTELYAQRTGAKEFVGLYLEYVDEDRNVDGRISIGDGIKVAVFDPELRNSITPEKIFRTGLEPAVIGDEIIIVGEDEDIVTAIHINLANRRVETVELVVSPGEK